MRLGMTFVVESSLGGLNLLRLELESPRGFIELGIRQAQPQARATGPLDGHAIPRNLRGGGGLTYCHHWSQAVVLTPSALAHGGREGARVATAAVLRQSRPPPPTLERGMSRALAICRTEWPSAASWWTWATAAVSSCFLGIFRNAAPVDRSGSRADAPLRRPAFSLGPCAPEHMGPTMGAR